MQQRDWLKEIRSMAAGLENSGIVDVFNYGRNRPGLVPFWVGESDLPTPAFISDAAIEALQAGHTFYTYQRGIPQLRQAVADYLGRAFATNIDPERIIITGSGMQGLVETMQLLVGPGDNVVVVAPVWPNIMAAAEMQDASVKPVTLDFTDGVWQLDLERLFAAVGPRTSAIFINSPGNPTGWLLSRDDMIAVRDFCRERDLWIIADEVYNRFVYDQPRGFSFLEIMQPDEKLIVTNTFSKNWLMTGWRVGWVVIPNAPVLGQIYENLVQYNTSGVATFLQYGCIAALEQGDGLVREMVERCRVGRDIVCTALAELPRVEFARPDGAFYVFFRVTGEHDCVAFAKRMVDEANVGLAPGSAFGAGGRGFQRLCFASSHTTLQTGVERLAAAIKAL